MGDAYDTFTDADGTEVSLTALNERYPLRTNGWTIDEQYAIAATIRDHEAMAASFNPNHDGEIIAKYRRFAEAQRQALTMFGCTRGYHADYCTCEQ